MTVRSKLLHVLCSLLLLVLWRADHLAASGAQKLTIRHVEQEMDSTRVRLYFDVRDTDGQPLSNLTADQVDVTLGRYRLETLQMASYQQAPTGARLVFLVDVSASMSDDQFEPIRGALSSWAGNLYAGDQAALVSFGDQSRVLRDFTADRSSLVRQIDRLAPRDRETVLYRALVDALELSQVKETGQPSYPALVVLTDGRDEGSGLTTEDVISAIRQYPAPIFSLGSSKLKGQERQRYFDVLKRLSATSGGAFFEVNLAPDGGTNDQDLNEAYRNIRKAIENVWYLDLETPEIAADGEQRRLQLTVKDSGRSLSQGIDFRLLPAGRSGPIASMAQVPNPPGLAPPEERTSSRDNTSETTAPSLHHEPTTGSSVAEDARNAVPTGSDQAPDSSSSLSPAQHPQDSNGGSQADSSSSTRWWWLLLAIAGLATGAWWFTKRDRPTRSATQPEPVLAPLPHGTPIVPKAIRFVVIRGSERGKVYQTTLLSSATVGKNATSDCLLADETIDPKLQLILQQEDGAVFLSHSGKQADVMVNGLSSPERTILRNNDLLGTQELILRVEFTD